jgi:hypothetical protein
LVSKALQIENLKVQIARLQRMQFVRSSKKFADDVGPLVLRLKELGVVPNSFGPPGMRAERYAPTSALSDNLGGIRSTPRLTLLPHSSTRRS